MDPNAMTKSQLKSALVGHDVSLPASARKSVFVGLYADHILFRNCNCRSATIRVKNGTKLPQMATSGFSSDDDIDDYIQPEQPKSSKAKETKSHRAMETLPFTQEQIEVMSSAELMETLRQHGINCGPIVPSTRLVYQKKLLNMLSGGQVKWRHHKEGDEAVQHSGTVNSYDDEEDDDANIYDSSDEDDDDDEEMTPAELNIVQTKRGKAVAPERVLVSGGLPKSPRRRIVPEVRFSRSEEEPASRQRRQSSGMVVVEPGKPMKKERRVPLYLQIIIFIFVSIIIYLIVYNLEPVFKNPVSRLH